MTLEEIRPAFFAVLYLSSGDLLPRQRARDQQADRAGLALQRCLLKELVAHDPDPEDLENVLMSLVEAQGPPSGPALAVARQIREDWEMACLSPEWVAQLVAQATRESDSAPQFP